MSIVLCMACSFYEYTIPYSTKPLIHSYIHLVAYLFLASLLFRGKLNESASFLFNSMLVLRNETPAHIAREKLN